MQDNKGYMGGLVKYNIIGSGSFADIYTCDYLDLLYGYNLKQESVTEIEKKLNEYVRNLEPTKQNEMTGLFKGKNMIFIHV